MDFLSLAQARYSCRKLDSRPVEQEKLDKIIAAAIAAPTANNAQPVRIWEIRSEQALEKLRSTARQAFVAQAPVVLILGAKPGAGFVRSFDGKDYAEIDAAIVATHILLAVQDQGLATTWVGMLDPAQLQALFPEMAGYELIALFAIGYAAADAQPAPRHAERLSRDEFVIRL